MWVKVAEPARNLAILAHRIAKDVHSSQIAMPSSLVNHHRQASTAEACRRMLSCCHKLGSSVSVAHTPSINQIVRRQLSRTRSRCICVIDLSWLRADLSESTGS
jgi:hypothetical protein